MEVLRASPRRDTGIRSFTVLGSVGFGFQVESDTGIKAWRVPGFGFSSSCGCKFLAEAQQGNLKPKAMFNPSSALRDLHILSVRRLQLRQGLAQTVGSYRLQRISRLDFWRKLKIL